MFSLQYAPKQQPARPSTARRSASSRPIASRPQASSHARITAPARIPSSARTPERTRAASQVLRTVLDDAATRPLDDHEGWDQLAVSARCAIDELISLAHVPATLGIAEDEPSVVVRRTVAAAWRRAVRSIGDDAIGSE